MTVPKVNDLTPVLETNDMNATIDYYTNILGFHLDFTWPDEGPVDHAGFSIGPIGDGDDHQESDHVHIHVSLSERKVENSGWLFININEIDELYAKYKSRNVKITRELDNFPWGYREFEVTGPNGHKFRFAKNLREEQ